MHDQIALSSVDTYNEAIRPRFPKYCSKVQGIPSETRACFTDDDGYVSIFGNITVCIPPKTLPN